MVYCLKTAQERDHIFNIISINNIMSHLNNKLEFRNFWRHVWRSFIILFEMHSIFKATDFDHLSKFH